MTPRVYCLLAGAFAACQALAVTPTFSELESSRAWWNRVFAPDGV
jgi:hypothetical protein